MGRSSLVVVVAAIAASAALSAWRRSHVVPSASLDAAAAAVRGQLQAGDVILPEPITQVGPRLRLGDLPLLVLSHVEAADLRPYRRVMLLQLGVIGAPAAPAQLLARIGQPVAHHSWPGVDLTIYRLRQHDRVLFDLRRDIRRVAVQAHYPDGSTAACDRFDRDRWVCPRDPGWSYVGRRIAYVNGQARACVWLHPLHRGGLLTVALPSLPVAGPNGAPRFIAGGFGFTASGARAARAPVHLRVFAGDRVVLDVQHAPGPAWRRYREPLPPGPVRIEVDTQNNGAAHFCAALRVVEPAS